MQINCLETLPLFYKAFQEILHGAPPWSELIINPPVLGARREADAGGFGVFVISQGSSSPKVGKKKKNLPTSKDLSDLAGESLRHSAELKNRLGESVQTPVSTACACACTQG